MARTDGFPTLAALLDELTRLDRGGALRGGKGGVSFKRGAEVGRFSWHGLGDFFLNSKQQDVVAVLLDAYYRGGNPDVPQASLLRAAKSSEPKLSRLFDGTDAAAAWGTLIVPGSAVGTFRLARPDETAEAVEKETTERGDDE